METKEEQFNRILQRMKNRRYLPTPHKSEGPSEVIHDRVLSTMDLIHHIAGDDCAISDAPTGIGEYPLIADRTKVGNNCLISKGVRVSFDATFGNGCLFEGNNSFNFNNHFGDYCLFGPGCTFGTGCSFGKDCVFLCNNPTAKPVVLKEFFVGNLDRTKRIVEIIIWSDYSIQVKAGCFTGPLGEFVERAENEGKLFYSRGIPLIANIAADQLRKDRGDI